MRRSSLLTYWTGKDIEKEIMNLNEDSRAQYLERLWSILEDGFWMNVTNEKVYGWSQVEGDTSNIDMDVPMVCFTELRLSKSQEHNKRYGLMGIVVDREFVLTRHGAPVFYIRSNSNESIVGNFVQMLFWINDQARRGTTGAAVLLDNVQVPLSFLKAMSASNDDDFENLNENELRIVHAHKRHQAGLIRVTGADRPKYKIPLLPKDVKMIVLPDSQIRDNVIQDTRIAIWFDNKYPPLLTVGEIREF